MAIGHLGIVFSWTAICKCVRRALLIHLWRLVTQNQGCSWHVTQVLKCPYCSPGVKFPVHTKHVYTAESFQYPVPTTESSANTLRQENLTPCCTSVLTKRAGIQFYLTTDSPPLCQQLTLLWPSGVPCGDAVSLIPAKTSDLAKHLAYALLHYKHKWWFWIILANKRWIIPHYKILCSVFFQVWPSKKVDFSDTTCTTIYIINTRWQCCL